MDKLKVATALTKLAKELVSADTFKCPTCDSKVLENTGYCMKCKKKVKKAGEFRGPIIRLNMLSMAIKEMVDNLKEVEKNPSKYIVPKAEDISKAVIKFSKEFGKIPTAEDKK